MKFLLSFLLVFAKMSFFAQNFNPVDIEKLGPQVNLDSTEESIPLFSKKLNKLFFVRSRINDKNELTAQDIFESSINGANSFSNGTEFDRLNNSKNNAMDSIARARNYFCWMLTPMN
jgi:hypothetical protein